MQDVELPPGPWRVVVRAGLQPSTWRPHRPDRGPSSVFPLPEDALADAVAEVAGLPAGAIRRSPVLAEPHFVLVTGVSREVAAVLVRRAVAAGYRAEATTAGGPPSRRGAWAIAGIAAIVGLFGVAVVAGADTRAAVAGAVLAGLALAGVWRMGLPGALPVAYPDAREAVVARADPATVPPAPDPPADPLARIEAGLADLTRYRATLLAQAAAGHAFEPEELALLDATIAEHARELAARRGRAAGSGEFTGSPAVNHEAG